MQPTRRMPRRIQRWPAAGFIIGLMGLLLTGCAALDQVIQKPGIAFEGLDIKDPSLLESTLNFRFKIDNPNPIGLHASRITYHLNLNGSKFADGRLDQGLSVPSKSAGILSIPVTVAYLDFLDSITAMIHDQTAAYDLRGTVAVGPVDIPFNAKGSFKLPRLPKISVASVKIDQLSLLGASLVCRLQMDNPNTFDVLLKQLSYAFKLGDSRIASADLTPDRSLGRAGQSQYDLRMNLSFADIGRAGYQLLKGTGSHYQFEGKMLMDSPTVGERLVPFKASGRVPFIH